MSSVLLSQTVTEKELQFEERDIVVEYAYGVSGMSQGKYSTARKHFKTVINHSTDPTLSMRSEFLAGWCSYNLSHWESAAGWFGAYSKKNGLLSEYADYFRGISLTRAKKYKEAISSWNEYFTKYGETKHYSEARLIQCDALTADKRCDLALPILRKILKDTSHGDRRARILLKIGSCLEALGNIKEAKTTYRDIYIYRPGSGSASKAAKRLKEIGGNPDKMSHAERYKRAEKLYKRARWENALSEYTKLLQDKRYDRNNERGRLTAIRQAMCLYRMYRTEDAARAFKKFFTELPVGAYTSTSYYYYGHCMGRMEKNDEAMRSYRNVIEKTPSSSLVPGSWLNIAQIYGERDKWDEAIKCMDIIRTKHRASARKLDISWRIGWIYYRRGDFLKAAERFENHNGTKELVSRRNAYWRARSLERAGKKPEAAALYKAFLDEKPYGHYALWAWARMGKKPLESTGFDRKPSVIKIPSFSKEDERLDRSRELALMGLLDFAVEELASLETRKDLTEPDHEAICMLYQSYGDYYRSRRAVYRYLSVDTNRYTIEEDRYWRILYPRPYSSQILSLSKKRKVDPNHVWSIIMQESNFRHTVTSSAGAMGLMQLIRPTAKQMAKRLNLKDFTDNDLFDPYTNILMGVNYLADVADKLGTHSGRFYLATAGYNGGPTNVRRWARARPDLEVDEWVEEIPFSETRKYVKRVFSNRSTYQMLYGKGDIEGVTAPVGVKIRNLVPAIFK